MKHALFEDHAVIGCLQAFLEERLGIELAELAYPDSGVKTPIVIVRPSDRDPLVIKLILGWHNVIRLVRKHRCLVRLGLPVPRLLAWSVRSRLGATGRFAVVEEYLPGEPYVARPVGDRPRCLALIAEALAQLHSIQRSYPGSLFLWTPRSYMRRYMPRVEVRLKAVADVMPKSANALGEALRREARRIEKRGSYELIHGHVNPNNFLVDGDRVHLIDLKTVHFGDAARDLVRAFHRLCKDEADNLEIFRRHYFAAVESPTAEETARFLPFYEADYGLGRALGWIREWRKGALDEQACRARMARDMDRALDDLARVAPA